jgi:hypothetical protein
MGLVDDDDGARSGDRCVFGAGERTSALVLGIGYFETAANRLISAESDFTRA